MALVGLIVSDMLEDQLGLLLEEIHSQWSWVLGTSYLNNLEFSLIRQFTRNALPHADVVFKACMADVPDCARCDNGLGETAEHAFFYYELVHTLREYVGMMMAIISSQYFVQLNIALVVDNTDPLWTGS